MSILFKRTARHALVLSCAFACGMALAQDTVTIGQVAPLSGVLATLVDILQADEPGWDER